MIEKFTLRFPDSSVNGEGPNNLLYRASGLLRAFTDPDYFKGSGIPIDFVMNELDYHGDRSGVWDLESSVINDIVVGGNTITFTVKDNYSGFNIPQYLADKLKVGLGYSCTVLFDDGLKDERAYRHVEPAPFSPNVWGNRGFDGQRAIIRKPEYEFLVSLDDLCRTGKVRRNTVMESVSSAEAVYEVYGNKPEPRLTLSVTKESDKGFLVYVKESGDSSILHPLFVGNNTFFESKGFLDKEHDILVGPCPVLDGELVFQRITDCVTQSKDASFKIDKFGREIGSVSLSEISSKIKLSELFENISYFDAMETAREVGLMLEKAEGEQEHYSATLSDIFCQQLEKRMKDRIDGQCRLALFDEFVSPEVKRAALYETAFLNGIEGLSGIKRDSSLKGSHVASVDGYDVVVKMHPDGSHFVSLVKDDHGVGFLNAVQEGEIPAEEIVSKAYQKAVKRDKALKKFESFKSKIGLGSMHLKR